MLEWTHGDHQHTSPLLQDLNTLNMTSTVTYQDYGAVTASYREINSSNKHTVLSARHHPHCTRSIGEPQEMQAETTGPKVRASRFSSKVHPYNGYW